MTRPWTAFLLGGGLLLGIGCRTAPQTPPPLGSLAVRVTPEEASVLIDDFPIARGSGVRRVRVPVGKHRMEVRAPGYFAAYREFVMKAAEDSVLIELALRADPNAELDAAPSAAAKLPAGPTVPRLPELP